MAKTLKARELRDLAAEELVQKEKAFKKELFELNFQRKSGRVDKPSRFKLLRKDIARIKTVLKEKELNKESESHGTKNK